MSGAHELPGPLLDVLEARGLEPAWGRLEQRDRDRYRDWVASATRPRSARRRAALVGERVADGRGWAGPLRRQLHHHVGVPRGATVADAHHADGGSGIAGWVPSD